MGFSELISDRILAECFGRPHAYYELGRLCDTVGGRSSGTESGRRGEEWALELMKSYGLENITVEEFPVLAWTRGELEVAAVSPSAWRLTALSHGYAPSKAEVTAEVFDIGHGESDDYLRVGERVRGGIVLCDEGVAPGHRGLHRSEKLKLAADNGAAALMIYSSASGGLPRTGTCANTEAPIPSLGISQEDGLRLLRLLKSSDEANRAPIVSIRMTNHFEQSTARNVIGELRGSELPDEHVLLGAHLDSWDVAQGATDNGLGSAIVLEIGRVLTLLQRPRRTIRFAIWAAEEIGLCGSWHYSRLHETELDSMTAVINFDMTADPYGFWLPTPLEHTHGAKEAAGLELLRSVAARLAPLGMKQEFVFKAGLHSDHQAFMLGGVQAIALLAENKTQGAHYYHSVGDTFDKVSLPSFSRAAAVGAHTAWALADAPYRPFKRQSPGYVRQLIDEAGLMDALAADGYDGPAMHIS